MLTPLPHMLKPRFACLCAALLFCLPPAGHCAEAADQDNVISTIKEALQQYEKGDYTSAASNLNYASQLVLQKKSEQMRALIGISTPWAVARSNTARADLAPSATPREAAAASATLIPSPRRRPKH